MDNFREWLSDNLRYFMLGGIILIIVAVLFFGIRACVGGNKGNTDRTDTTVSDTQKANPSSPTSDGESNDEKKEDDNPLVEGSAEMTALFENYYEALGKKDVASIKNYVENLLPSDEVRIANALYIEGYELEKVYVKKGLTDGTYVAYSTFNYICTGVETPVPALSQFYVITDNQGNLKIDGRAESKKEVIAYTEELEKSADIVLLTAEVKEQYEDAQKNDPELAKYLAGLGEDNPGDDASSSEGSTTSEGEMVTATDDCNVRAAASGDAEVIGGLPTGTQVQKTGTEGEWIQIDYYGQTGYVYNTLLE